MEFKKNKKAQVSIEILAIIGVLVIGAIIVGTMYINNINNRTSEINEMDGATSDYQSWLENNDPSCESDGDCTGIYDICDNGTCVECTSTNTSNCETDEICSSTRVCVVDNPAPTPECENTGDCDDGVSCTVDSCNSGRCSNVTDDSECDDSNPCTINTCDAINGCESQNKSNGTSCGTDMVCQSGLCVTDTPTPTPDCSSDGDCGDGVSCTVDSCNSGSCSNVADDSRCGSTGNECTYYVCDVTDDCQEQNKSNGTPCDSGNGTCTSGNCVPNASDSISWDSVNYDPTSAVDHEKTFDTSVLMTGDVSEYNIEVNFKKKNSFQEYIDTNDCSSPQGSESGNKITFSNVSSENYSFDLSCNANAEYKAFLVAKDNGSSEETGEITKEFDTGAFSEDYFTLTVNPTTLVIPEEQDYSERITSSLTLNNSDQVTFGTYARQNQNPTEACYVYLSKGIVNHLPAFDDDTNGWYQIPQSGFQFASVRNNFEIGNAANMRVACTDTGEYDFMFWAEDEAGHGMSIFVNVDVQGNINLDCQEEGDYVICENTQEGGTPTDYS